MHRLLTVLVLAGFAVASPASAVISSDGNWEYLVISGNATIIKYRGVDTEIVVPSTIDGYSVHDIRGPLSGQGVFSNSAISVALPTSLTNIGRYAFYSSAISEISIPSGVKKIGEYAFHYNYNLTNVVLAEGIQSIEREAFKQTGVKQINFPTSLTNIGYGIFQFCPNLTNAYFAPSLLEELSESAFHETAIKSITLPPLLKKIGPWALARCPQLASISIPLTMTNISESAFRGASLIALSIPDSVIYIGASAFEDCYAISSIHVGTGLNFLGDRAFSRVLSLETIMFRGNAPSLLPPTFGSSSSDPFYDTPPFTLYYKQGTTGWGSTFTGRQTTLSGNFSLTFSSDPTKGVVTNSPSGSSFSSGTSVTVSAVALAGYKFSAWSGDFISTNNPLVLVMDANKTVAANFDPDNADTDGDGLSNYQEVILFNTSPNQAETNSPVAGLYLASQYQANRAGGRNEVLASPNSYGLFNSNQMLDLKFGGMVIGKSNNQLVLTYQINQSTNLTTWTAYREESLVLSNAPADKMFLRLAPK